MKYYLAIDIGASSGRGIIGYMDHDILKTDEIYRFKNEMIKYNNSLTWDIEYLFNEVKNTIKETLKKYPKIESMSIDTWGVDYCLIDDNNNVIKPCFAYRDDRTKESVKKVHEIIPFENLYEITGTQFQEFNTIYQLYKDKLDSRLDKAKTFLQIPCYLMFKLTNVMVHEYTNASTTGLIDGASLDYSKEIIDKLGFNHNLFMPLKKPGFVLGEFSDDIKKEVGGSIKVVLCSTHDTASAVEGLNAKENNLYISSGTWSLLGIKNDKTIRNKESMNANYSNEFGKDYIRFQKNIMGLWISQCLSKELGVSFSDMSIMSYESNYNYTFDCNLNRFLSPNNMKTEIISYFKELNLEPPKTNSDLFRTVYRSLAYSYKNAIEELESITNKKFDKIYIVGGGAKNKFLNESVEIIAKKEVIALPIEATSIGNLLSQMEN